MTWLQVLKTSDYKMVPWKNGGGVTQDVLLLPASATHDDFDVRLSLAPISAEGPFSAFPGMTATSLGSARNVSAWCSVARPVS